jgi:hypothetical protein
MTKADLYSGIFFVLLGIATIEESYRMPRFEELGVNPYSVPGLVPGIIGAVILVLGLVLFGRSALRLRTAGGAAGDLPNLSRNRLLVTLALTLGYAAGLVGHIPFWLATFLFVTGFITVFEWQPDAPAGVRARRLVAAVVIGAVVSATVTTVFRHLFLVQLP